MTNKQNTPSPLGPYTQIIEIKNIIFISGQIPIIPETGIIPNNIYDQTYQALNNIKNLLKLRNLEINNIVKITLFIKNINDLNIINTSYKNFFDINNTKNNKLIPLPTRTCIEVSKLPKNAKIEIEAIAIRH